MKPFTVSTTLSLCVLVIIIAASCGKHDNTPNISPNNNPSPPTVYVLGTEYGSTRLWKNGFVSELPISINSDVWNVSGNTLYVSGNNVYVAGYVNTGNTAPQFHGLYTKNGVVDSLAADSAQSVTSYSIFVSGNDVYVAGVQSYDPLHSTTYFTTLTAPYPIAGNVAAIWKNGVESHLQSYGYPGGAGDSNRFCARYYNDYVSGIQVSGNDVYVSGGSHQYQSGNPASYQFAEYWKNGVPVSLVKGLLDSSAQTMIGYPVTTGIAVSGSDVYVSGYEGTTMTGRPVFNALYWKNGVPTYFTNTAAGSMANAVAVSGNDVYLCGYENINDTSKAILWKNGVATILPYPGSANAYSVFVYGTDVYVAGYGWVAGGNNFSVYWKNGVLTTLSNGTQSDMANSIWVTKYSCGFLTGGFSIPTDSSYHLV